MLWHLKNIFISLTRVLRSLNLMYLSLIHMLLNYKKSKAKKKSKSYK